MDKNFTASIEGKLFDDNPYPIFAKALTHNSRVIWLWPGFEFEPDYLEYAQRRIAEHHREYESEAFPIAYYVLFLSDLSMRFTVEGEVIGIFDDRPIKSSFEVGGTSYTIE